MKGVSLLMRSFLSSGPSLKRSASASNPKDVEPAAKLLASAKASSSSDPVIKENPKLTKLLEEQTHIAVSVPPPVPTKWHQEPRETLPKGEDNLKKFLPPHPAERAAASAPKTSTTVSRSSTSNVFSPNQLQTGGALSTQSGVATLPSTSAALPPPPNVVAGAASRTILQPRSNSSFQPLPSQVRTYSRDMQSKFYTIPY